MKKNEINIDARNGYNIWSQTYDSDENPLIYLEEREVVRLLGDVKNKKILDVGCGTGRISLRLLRRGARVFGIDTSEKMLKNAEEKTKKYANKCEFKIASAYKIPFKKNEFNIVTFNLVLSHLKDLDKSISEMTRVLKKDGIMIISDLHPYAMIFKNARTVFYNKNKKYRITNYIYLFEDLIKIFRKNKLEILDVKDLKDTEKCLDLYIAVCKKYGKKISREKEYKEWVGKPGALIIKLRKK